MRTQLRKIDRIGRTRRTKLITDMKNNLPNTQIAKRIGISPMTVARYKRDMLAKPIAYDLLNDGKGVLKMLDEVAQSTKRLYDTYLEYLADPETGKFDPTPRASEVEVLVIGTDADGNQVKQKQSLQSVLDDLREMGCLAVHAKVNTVDVRKLITEQANALTKQLELIATLQGKIKDVTISVVNSPVWVQIQQVILDATKDAPAIREKLAEELGKIGQ